MRVVLNSIIRLLDLELMNTTFIPYPSLLQIQIKSHTRLDFGNFLAKSLS